MIVSEEMLDQGKLHIATGFTALLRAQGLDTFKNIMERKGGETTEVALDWLERNRSEPFFLFLHYYDPHMEYEPPEPFASAFSGNPYAGEIAFTDHCVGKDVIYSAFAWSCAEEAYPLMKALAQKHNVGFFDASGPDAEIIFPDGTSMKQGGNNKPWWKFW